MKKFIKNSLIAMTTFGLSFSLLQQASFAKEKVDGKCSITIDKSKHTSINNSAKATGKCGNLVKGFYGSGNYIVTGGYDGIVVNNEKYNVTIMPGFYTYEVTVHTVANTIGLKTPTVSSVSSLDKKVTGSTVPNAKVTVKAGKNILGSAKADKNGKFNVKLKKSQKVGTKLTVSITKGKETKSKTVIVKYQAPKVNKVKPTATKVTGTTVSMAKVTVKSGSKVLGTATANKKGSYTVKIKKQKVGTKLSISAVKSKITTKTTTVTVK